MRQTVSSIWGSGWSSMKGMRWSTMNADANELVLKSISA